MKTMKFPQIHAIEIHIKNSDTFCQKFGKRVRKMVGGIGGRYNDTRGHQNSRYVTVPCNEYKMTEKEFNTQLDLIDQIAEAYHVDAVLVRDSTMHQTAVHHSRPLMSRLKRTRVKEWSPATAREYIERAKAKHLEWAEGCTLHADDTQTVTVLGQPHPDHFHNPTLFNMYARAWRIMWRQTVGKLQRVADRWKFDIISLEVVSDTAERASGSAERERSRGR